MLSFSPFFLVHVRKASFFLSVVCRDPNHRLHVKNACVSRSVLMGEGNGNGEGGGMLN